MLTRKSTTAAEIELLQVAPRHRGGRAGFASRHCRVSRALPVIGSLLAGLTTGKWGFKVAPFMDLGGLRLGQREDRRGALRYAEGTVRKTLHARRRTRGHLRAATTRTALRSRGPRRRGSKRAITARPGEVHVDKLVGAPGFAVRAARASTLGTVDALQKELTRGGDRAAVGRHRREPRRRRPQLTAGDREQHRARNSCKQDIERRSPEAENTLAFLEQQLPQLRKQLDAAEQRYNTFRNVTARSI